jgi:RNA-binding protein
MEDLSGWQKRHLRALAHHLKPLIQIGKLGVNESSIAAITKALDDHELIKVKFLGFKEEKDELSVKIANQTGAVIAGIIGNVLIIYKKNHDPDKIKIHMPKQESNM